VLKDLSPHSFTPLDAFFKKGRFKEEFNIELKLGGVDLCHIKVFTGRPPYYKPWAEVFNMNPKCIGSVWELFIYCTLYRYMEPGDTLYVEYVDDPETFAAAQRGAVPQETRLGRLLTACGFRIVKDWYFPEGGLEGGMKLEAEKV
jgi:Uncharacterized conserved protein